MEEKKVEAKKENKLLSFEKGGIVWSVWNFLEAALFLVLGILSIVFVCQANGDGAKLNDLMSTLLNVVGIFLIIGGALKILANFMPIFASNHLEAMAKAKIKDSLSYDMVIGGSVELAGGIALVTMYSEGLLTDVIIFISRFLGLFIGVLLLVAAASLIVMGIAIIISKLYKLYLPIVEFVFAAVLIALGVVAIIFLQDEKVMAITVMIILAIVLIIAAIALTVVTISAIKAAHAVKTVVEDIKSEATAIEEKKADEQVEENSNEASEKSENQ